jgi:site-specific DNA recombinase
METIKKVIGYCRVSTNRQEHSRDAQEFRIRKTAESHPEWELQDVIIDFDECSGNLNRPGVQRVLEMVRNKTVDAVIICKMDRITRSTRDAIDLIELFAKQGVTLVSLNESLDTSSAIGRFFVRTLASIAELEREITSERTTAVLRYQKSQGYPAGATPYGWTRQPKVANVNGRLVSQPLVINESEQEILSKARDLRATGQSYQRIAAALNEGGYRTRTGGQWVKQYVIGILKTSEVAAA